MERKICIVGSGGFGREVLLCVMDIFPNRDIWDVACFMVDNKYYKEGSIMGVPVIPMSSFNSKIYSVVVAIGDPLSRRRVVERLPADTIYGTIIHPTAVISKFVKVGRGSIITAGCILTCNIEIGNHAHLNLHTTVGHDCVIGDYFTTAPAVNISGNCNIGTDVYFGTNSSIKQGINVCSGATIGMNAAVVKDIVEPGVYVGVPAKRIK